MNSVLLIGVYVREREILCGQIQSGTIGGSTRVPANAGNCYQGNKAVVAKGKGGMGYYPYERVLLFTNISGSVGQMFSFFLMLLLLFTILIFLSTCAQHLHIPRVPSFIQVAFELQFLTLHVVLPAFVVLFL